MANREGAVGYDYGTQDPANLTMASSFDLMPIAHWRPWDGGRCPDAAAVAAADMACSSHAHAPGKRLALVATEADAEAIPSEGRRNPSTPGPSADSRYWGVAT